MFNRGAAPASGGRARGAAFAAGLRPQLSNVMRQGIPHLLDLAGVDVMVEHCKYGVSRLCDVHRPDIGEAVRHLRQELVARARLARLLGWPPLVVVEPAH